MWSFFILFSQAFLELPIEVKYGSIGKLSLKIPWTSLNTSPVVVTVQVESRALGDVAIAYDCAQDIYLVAAPLNHRAYNKEKDESMDKMRKRRFLQKVEGISVIKKAAKAQNSKEEKLKRELWETMIATFMNNIQLQVHR